MVVAVVRTIRVITKAYSKEKGGARLFMLEKVGAPFSFYPKIVFTLRPYSTSSGIIRDIPLQGNHS